MAKIIQLDQQQQVQPQDQPKAQIITIDPEATLKTHNQGAGKPTQQEQSQYVERQPAFREAIGKDIPSAIAFGGGFAGPGGGVAGSMIGQGLRDAAPSLFGGEDSGSVAGDVLSNAVIPSVLGKIGNFIRSPREAMTELLSSRVGRMSPGVKTAVAQDVLNQSSGKLQQMRYPETGILESAATNVDDAVQSITKLANDPNITPTQFNKVWTQYQNQYGKNTVAKALLKLSVDVDNSGSVAAQQAYKKISGQALSDVSQVRNFKMATGEPDTISQLATRKVIDSGYNAGSKTFNPDVILSELNGAKDEIYKEAITPATRTNLTDLANAVKEQQTALEGKGSTDKLISYAKHRLIFALPFAAVGGLNVGTGVAGGIILGDAAINKAMRDPALSQMVVQAIKTGRTSQAAPLLQKAIINGLRGTAVVVQNADGEEENATIDQQGRVVPRR